MGSSFGAVRVFRDEQPVSPILASADEAFGWILGHQPMSTDWAMRYEGYSIRPVIAEPWPAGDASDLHGREQIRAMAVNTFRHDHPMPVGSREWDAFTGGETDQEDMVRDNCHACALGGYGEIPAAESKSGHVEPNGAFPRTHVQAGRPIPRRWAPALHFYLNSDHNPGHRAALLRDLATWGVRFTD